MKISIILNVSILTSIAFGAYIQNTRSSSNAKPVLPIQNDFQNDKAFDLVTGEGVKTVETNDDDQIQEQSNDVEAVENNNGNKVPVQCSRGDYQIKSASELAQLHECNEIIGSIFISDYQGATIDTGDISSISGDLIISNASNLVRINVPKLAVIAGKFGLKELTSLTSVHAPHLNTIGSVEWKVLPILSTVNFETGIKKVKSIVISDTSLVAFAGFESDVLDTLNINNNRFLETISTGLTGINEKLSISANARNIMVSFPNLEYANNITVRDVSSLDFGRIVTVNKSLELINNKFQAVKFPKLKSVGGTLSLIENSHLKEVEFPQVEEVAGGLMIINNTYLNKLNFFPKLVSIGGAIKFIGDFRDASFNKLRVIKGSAFIETIADGFDCSRWTKRDADHSGSIGSIIRGGSVVCRSSGQEQTVKYNNEGEVVDESISVIDDHIDKSTAGFTNACFRQSVSSGALVIALSTVAFLSL